MNGDWNEWSDQWRSEHAATPSSLIERTTRARRALVAMPVLSVAVSALALGGVLGPLYHASSVLDLGVGSAVAIGICVACLLYNVTRRESHAHADEPPARYLMLRRELCVRRIRFASLVWVLAALDLAFLFPWWAGGIRYHGFGFRLVHVTSLWVPLALIVGVSVAAARIRARAVEELRSIAPSS